MNKNIRSFKLLITVAIITTLLSCNTAVDVELEPYELQLVGNCILQKDSDINVYVSHSIYALDDAAPPAVDYATVSLFEDGNFIQNLANSNDGKYSATGFTPSANKNYSLTISANNFKTIDASTQLPSQVLINSFAYDSAAITNSFGESQSSLEVKFTDPAGEENYYEISIVLIDSFQNFPDTTYYVSSYPTSLESNNPSIEIDNYSASYALISDKFFDGENFTGNLLFYENYLSNKYLIFKSVSKEYYLYKKSLPIHLNTQDNPFAEPAQVYSNFNNGLGILGAANRQVLKIIP